MKIDFSELRCCDELMTSIPEQRNTSLSWVCLKCGAFATFNQGQFDEEELENLVLNYELK